MSGPLSQPIPTGRVAGIDYGRRRIGVAVCDAFRIIASPLCLHETTGDHAADAVFFAGLAERDVGRGGAIRRLARTAAAPRERPVIHSRVAQARRGPYHFAGRSRGPLRAGSEWPMPSRWTFTPALQASVHCVAAVE
jgi:hypothetical protein